MKVSSSRIRGWRWTKNIRLRGVLLGLFVCAMGSAGIYAQEAGADRQTGRGQEATKQSSQQAANRGAQPSADIVTDNLNRVAATAKQILEILSGDAGLIVEFKRMIAEDASASGQLLEESDLDERALADRLSEDLRTRVLATRLLQRYGYLVPKLNPDSELAAEHNLAMRERAAEIEGTAGHGKATPQTVIQLTQGMQPPAERLPNQGYTARPPLVAV